MTRTIALLFMIFIFGACGSNNSGSMTGAQSNPLGPPAENPSSTQPVRNGTWGGDNIQVIVTGSGGEIRFGCYQGGFDRPLVASSDGTFSDTGWVVNTEGPVTPAYPHTRHPANFRGQVSSDKMRLIVDHIDDSGQPQSDVFDLTYGNQGSLHVCPF
jgi:hypothetical protein